jgi:hypothetical protein
MKRIIARAAAVLLGIIMVATAAPSWALAQTTSSRTVQQGSQLLPEAQPPFDPGPDAAMAGSARAPQGAGKFTERRPSVAAGDAGAGSDAQGSGCNISVCARFYSSFNASTCTYQPYDGGPRRLCER